jgi:protein-disulfide isomerase
MLARCAGEKRYFGMINVLFRQQTKWARSPNPTAELQKIARLGGISKEQFESCVKNEDLMNQILETRLKGNEEHGIDSTPSFLINGDKYTGEMSLAEWDDLLAKYLP